MRYSRTIVATAVASVSLALMAAPAYADTGAVLTTGSLAGDNATVGDVLTAVLSTGTTGLFATASGGTTGVSCAASSFSATVVDNPAAPGTATESTTAQTFGTCTANITGVTSVNSVVVANAPFATTVASDGTVTVSGTSAAPIQTTLSLGTILGSISCVYQAASITGTASNTDNSITFTNQAFPKVSGSILCPSNGYFTAKYAPVLDTTVSGSPAIFTN
jgi:hypothetical protein